MNRTSTLKSRLCLAFSYITVAGLLLTLTGNLQAQHNIQKYDDYLTSLLGSEDPVEVAKGERLHELVENLLPIVFITGGEEKTPMGTVPVIIRVDQISMGMINSSTYGYNRRFVEMAAITLSDPEGYIEQINPTGLRGFENIKYLFFTFAFPLCEDDPECELQKVRDLLLGPGNQRVVVLYRVAIPI